MEWLKSFVSSFFTYLYDGFKWILQGAGHVISYTLYIIYDGLLTVIYSVLAVIDFSSVMFNMAAQYSNLPTQLIYLINVLAIPEGIAIIVSALTIRLLLNLIPSVFTRV